MPHNMPSKHKKKVKKNYEKMARFLKDLVSFDIDLRQNNNSMGRGKKAALTRAMKEHRAYQSQTFVLIKRTSKETKKAYNERLIQTKKDLGQPGSFFPGVYIDTPNFINITKKKTKNKTGKWTTQIEFTAKTKDKNKDWKELYIPVGNGLDFAQDPNGILDGIREKYGKEYKNINPNHSGFRGFGGGMEDDEDWDRFKTRLRKWAYKYAPITENNKNELWLSGFYVSTHIRTVDLSPKKKKSTVNAKGRNV